MKLGRYRLVAELARGGMAVIWLAEARGAAGFVRPFVLKELAPELARDPRYRAMFRDEARLAGKLVHKNIVQTLDVGAEDERLFMVLELLEGCSLELARGRLAPRRFRAGVAAAIVREALAGLHHAHERGVVHRDVTPQNLFLTSSGEVKLLDFGLARSREPSRLSEHGIVKGSVAYLSPDHVVEASIDRRADVFAAGIILRELLCGARMWGDLDASAIVRRLVARDLPEWPESAVPHALRTICDRAMAPSRADRYPTAAAMRDALDAWLACAPRDAGTLADVAHLFERELAAEGERAQRLLRAHPAEPPPVPLILSSSHLESLSPSPSPLVATSRRRAAAFLLVAVFVAIFVVGAAVDHAARSDTHSRALPAVVRCG